MKKLLLVCTIFFAFLVNSQNSNQIVKGIKNNQSNNNAYSQKIALTNAIITDTLHYFYNKQLYKIPNATGLGFPYYKSPASTGTAVTHVGSVFLNNDSIIINGLEVMAAYNDGSATVHTTIRGRLYLCKLNAQNIPILPAVDSVNFNVGSAQLSTGHPKGWPVGGNFTTPRRLLGNFAVLVRNVETTQGDTIRILRTAAITPTNSSGSNSNKFGEGLGIVRKGGIISKTTNFGTAAFGFGNGTDYEFCVAPRVSYSLVLNHAAPDAILDSVDCWQPLTFTNTSSAQLTSRFFNLNSFYVKWAPFVSTPPGGFSSDSAASWSFDDEDLDNPNLRPDIFLHYGSNTATKYYDTSALFGIPSGCFNNCKFKTNLRKMAAESGRSMEFKTDSTFIVCVKSCGEVGIKENLIMSNISIYPNPLTNGKLMISGLEGENKILVYNMTGQLIINELVNKDRLIVDLLKHPQGSYFIRVINTFNNSKTFKIINQKE